MHREWNNPGTTCKNNRNYKPVCQSYHQKARRNKTFVQMMEALGYDVELTYVRRKGNTAGDAIAK